MAAAEEQKRILRGQWNAVATGWDRWHDWYAKNFQPLMSWCCDAAALAPGDRVLDLACGSGEPALSAAERVRPRGSVVAVDISPDMLQVAERRARTLGLEHVEFREMDAEELAFADHSFDAVTFACGLMFCADPVRALEEIRRVLKPRGRFAIVVWDDHSRNAFLTVIGRAFAQVVQSPPPMPNAPTAFRFAPPGELERVLHAGGLSDIVIDSRAMTVECASIDEYLEICSAMSAGLRAKLDALAPEDRARFEALVREGARPYLDGQRLRLPATVIGASGRA